jgi:hypothetical protein
MASSLLVSCNVNGQNRWHKNTSKAEQSTPLEIDLSMGSSSRPQTGGQTLTNEASIEGISGILPGLRRRQFDKMPGLAFTKKATISNTM